MKSSALIDEAGTPSGRMPEPNVFDLGPRRERASSDEPRIVVQSMPDDDADLATLRAGLLATPASSSPKFFYDPQGSALFSAICALDEYYPTRTEARIFDDHRDAIADVLPSGAQWVDLGCGDGVKARGWLDAAQVRRYVGVDIAAPWLRAALLATAASANNRPPRGGRSRSLDVVGVVTDFTRPFDLHDVLAEAPGLPPVFFYPGSSIGNFVRDDAKAFLTSIRTHIERHPASGGKLMVGIDLVKDRATLRAAYDDAIGVTAAFNRNVLRVANRLLGSDFDPVAFDHRAVFDESFSRIEMQLVSRRDQTVRIGEATRRYAAGEAITTEYSHKYTVDAFEALLAAAGFATGDRLHLWTDERQWFGVFVAEPR